MLSRTLLTQSILSEDQFIADLTSLFRRRNLSFGEPQDLERLASDLVADGTFRAALFNLCTVISHMGEVESTPQELLVLVARASGGPGIFDAEGNITIPHNTETAFLTGYEAWIHRDLDLEATASEHRHSEPFHEAMMRSAAEGPRTSPAPQHPPNLPSPPSQPRPIPSNAPLDSLTLGELRQYLDEIERRVSQIEPHLDQVVRNDQSARDISPSASHFEQLDALESERIHEVIPLTPTVEPAPAPEPELVAESIQPTPPAEEAPALAAESMSPPVSVEEAPALAPLSIASTEPPAPAIQPEATDAALDAARLRRLRAANIILAILLVISTVFAGFVVFRYVNSRNQPANLAATPDQPPATEPASPPTVPQTSPRIAPPHPVPAAGHDTKPSQALQAATASQAASAATAPPDAVVFPPAVAPPEANPPAPVVRQAAEPTPANPAPTQAASTPAAPPPAETKPAESAARTNDALPTRPTPAPPTPQVAEAAPAAAPATIPRPPLPVTTTVNVSSSKMMAYAIAKPAPVPPANRHSNRETTVEIVAIISKDGKVTSTQALTGTSDVRAAAIQAMEAWRFKPYLVNGNPVEVITTFKFLFKGQ
jgi:protein TonB